MSFRSWGGLPVLAQQSISLDWQDQVSARLPSAGLVAGCGRSYGDVGLAATGVVASCLGLDRVLSFDREAGLLHCEAGVTLGDILALVLPLGWVLPVLPGTRHVSVAGAIANDVHGKNHHRQGTFGRHVKSLLLQRSDGTKMHCSRQENTDWFEVTVAGLGLSGVILEATIRLMPAASGCLSTETIKFHSLDEFFSLSQDADEDWEYSAAWIDCLSSSVRGHFSRARYSERSEPVKAHTTVLNIPFSLPVAPVNRFSLGVFNSLYFHRRRHRVWRSEAALIAWMFPLDRIGNWNRLYGRKGFRQYQCVVDPDAIAELLGIIRRAGTGSFLAVLKMFGDVPSPGLLSFPRQGASLALDFPWRAEQTTGLFTQLDAVVASCGGAIYPAKDAHMNSLAFQAAYPAWQTIEQYRDPNLNSLFWQRVMEGVE